MPDALTLLKDDHKKVEGLFKKYEKTTDRAHVTRRDLVHQIIEELSVHAAIEEQVLYPVAREVEDLEPDTLEALEEHHVAKLVLAELEHMDPSDERFHPKVTVLIENVRHHVEEEESEMFPALRAALSRSDLAELGEALQDAKAAAPTRPHPGAPDEPPGNVLVGAISGLIDRVRDGARAVLPG
jgi:hemerythrin superfamily protein